MTVATTGMENTLSEKYEANRASIFWGVEHASK
jgi:hypothetical protein